MRTRTFNTGTSAAYASSPQMTASSSLNVDGGARLAKACSFWTQQKDPWYEMVYRVPFEFYRNTNVSCDLWTTTLTRFVWYVDIAYFVYIVYIFNFKLWRSSHTHTHTRACCLIKQQSTTPAVLSPSPSASSGLSSPSRLRSASTTQISSTFICVQLSLLFATEDQCKYLYWICTHDRYYCASVTSIITSACPAFAKGIRRTPAKR